jgi:hypothetical protein
MGTENEKLQVVAEGKSAIVVIELLEFCRE